MMLNRLACISDMSRGRALLTVLLRLFGLCIKVSANLKRIIDPKLNAIGIMLQTLKLCLAASEQESGAVTGHHAGQPSLTEQLLEVILSSCIHSDFACHWN